jgi:hypothetical protein
MFTDQSLCTPENQRFIAFGIDFQNINLGQTVLVSEIV